ncbi:flagellar basal body L-ring protein FlgH [Verminephrobacter aporrectodeae subsp. tuberculatae]|uniref:flagellar basal body L-ring protein FlgH n=2 Tax=Verminephrobacter aporrectodeae TaxID=1110389 RepID=UPI002237E0EA|nr:flagellar basal body L-ring protein FlgH [Verminephrobacter aporrectodeae]MCW5221707.1 flagellar basal body L-ring protein FlgH [Verminephrobacter aporrectodeae subsp. tuberculatae]MCW5290997.1 flagellar basal body L-ring protein FlgH [Verminephrobacter aporrectodeae subsp. tuberculatae]
MPTATLPPQPLLRAGAAGALLLCAGCASVSTPPVDIRSTAPPQLAAAPRTPPEVTGGLFRSASYRPAFEDRRARGVGDKVTVQIVENVTASQKSSSTLDRSAKESAGISNLPFVHRTLSDLTALGANSASAFSGKGGTESANMFSGSITTTVVEVLPNGHLVVSGEKQIGVNQNVDVLRFSGTVDPLALLPGSVISSTQVADVRVESRGRGAQDQVQAMGWLGRFFHAITPF